MNRIILKRKDGSTRTIKWGILPSEYHEPRYFDLPVNGEKADPENITSTLGKRTYKLTGMKKKGFWLWKYTEGYYEEED